VAGNIKVEVHATRHVARGGADPKKYQPKNNINLLANQLNRPCNQL